MACSVFIPCEWSSVDSEEKRTLGSGLLGSPELPTAVIVGVSTTGIGGAAAVGGSEWMVSLPGGWITECGEAVK